MTAARRLRHWANLVLQPAYRTARRDARRRYREKARLARMPRFTRTSTDLLGQSVDIADAASFLWTYQEIFENRIYEFRSRSPAPHIIDAGANIGLSVLFFKSLYRNATVTCFEPDPQIREMLERNIRAADLTGVTVEPYALAAVPATVPFISDGADGGRLAGCAEVGAATTAVAAVRLRDYLDRHVDLLKLDIEGAETEVLLDSEDRLDRVERVYVEYHSFAHRPQSLHLLLAGLHRAGFRIHIVPAAISRQPFVRRRAHDTFDMQLHVFGYRDDDGLTA